MTPNKLQVDSLVVGGGIAGMCSATITITRDD
jgi:succinate dehydrogenase/fumarate reductase flavoprotein subunit